MPGNQRHHLFSLTTLLFFPLLAGQLWACVFDWSVLRPRETHRVPKVLQDAIDQSLVNVDDVDPVTSLPLRAKYINLSFQNLGDPYQMRHFVGLARSFQSIQRMDLSSNDIVTLHGEKQGSIGWLPNLEKLSLAHNKIRSFNDLAIFESLLELDLGDNNILSAQGCVRYKKLTRLVLADNPIEYKVTIAKMTILPEVVVSRL